jgi:hypothetical protein
MKNLLLLCAIVSFCTAAACGQQRENFDQACGKLGAGIVMGQPTGLSLKYRFSQENALEGAIGPLPDGSARVNLDYLWHAHPFRSERFGFDYGAGVAFGPGAPWISI